MHIQQALAILELPLDSFNIPRNIHPNFAIQKLEEFKEVIKSQRKKLVKKYHPDLQNGNEEKMKLINNTVDELMKIQIQIRPPMPRIMHIVINHSFRNSSTTTSYSSGFYTNNF